MKSSVSKKKEPVVTGGLGSGSKKREQVVMGGQGSGSKRKKERVVMDGLGPSGFQERLTRRVRHSSLCDGCRIRQARGFISG